MRHCLYLPHKKWFINKCNVVRYRLRWEYVFYEVVVITYFKIFTILISLCFPIAHSQCTCTFSYHHIITFWKVIFKLSSDKNKAHNPKHPLRIFSISENLFEMKDTKRSQTWIFGNTESCSRSTVPVISAIRNVQTFLSSLTLLLLLYWDFFIIIGWKKSPSITMIVGIE